MLSHARRAAAAMAIFIAVVTVTAPSASAGQTIHYHGPYSTLEQCEADRPYYTIWPNDYTYPCHHSTSGYHGGGAGWYFTAVTTWDGYW